MSETNPVEDMVGATAPALQGDLTQGPILRTLALFSIPTLIANVSYALGQSINSIWVGQLLGEGPLAATVNANFVMFLAFAMVYGFGLAATVKIGQYYGMRDLDGARRACGTGIGFCLGIAIAASVIGSIWAVDLLHMMATPRAIMADALVYLRISLVSLPFSTLQLTIAMCLRGGGDARTPLYATILTSVLIVVLNPLLILGIGPFPELGVGGAALSILLANLGGVLLLVGWVYLRDLPLRLRGRELGYLVPHGEELAYVLAKGIPMGAQTLVASASSLVMIGLINREGTLTTAAFGAVIQLWSYVQMPAFAFSTAIGAMTAQSVGAGLHLRVAQITRAGLASTAVVTTLLALVLIAFGNPLLALFLGSGSAAVPLGAHIQAIAIWSWVFLGMIFAYNATMRSYGVVILPLIIMAIALFPLRIGFYFAAFPLIGPDALWWAYSFGTAISLGLTWLLYARGAWRKRHGVDHADAAERGA